MPDNSEQHLINEWVKEVQKANSNLEIPILGRIKVQKCQICKNAEWHKDTWDDPTCKAFKSVIPEKYFWCKSYDCPHFIHNPESSYNGVAFDDELNPIELG